MVAPLRLEDPLGVMMTKTRNVGSHRIHVAETDSGTIFGERGSSEAWSRPWVVPVTVRWILPSLRSPKAFFFMGSSEDHLWRGDDSEP